MINDKRITYSLSILVESTQFLSISHISFVK